MTPSPLILATRGSPLARWQAEAVAALCRERGPGGVVECRFVRTPGDRNQTDALASLGGTGLFTKEVDNEVLAGRAHLAVHSLKDLETTLAPGLALVLTLPRGPVEDVLLSRDGRGLTDLLPGARVGTGSLRRAAHLRRERPDLQVVPVRGNVDGRLRQLDEGRYEALIMARAGLERLGLGHRISEILTPTRFLPAPSQGIVGVTGLADAADLLALGRRIGCPDTLAAGRAERAFSRRLGGGCNAPLGALARRVDGRIELSGRVISLDGSRWVEGTVVGSTEAPEAVGQELADDLLRRGAGALLRAVEPPGDGA